MQFLPPISLCAVPMKPNWLLYLWLDQVISLLCAAKPISQKLSADVASLKTRARHPRWTTQRPIKPEIPKKILGADSWSMAAPLCRVQVRHAAMVVTNGGWWLGYWQFYRRPRWRWCWLFVRCSWNLRPQDVAIPQTIPISESVSTTHLYFYMITRYQPWLFLSIYSIR